MQVCACDKLYGKDKMKNSLLDIAHEINLLTGNDYARYAPSFMENVVTKRVKELKSGTIQQYLQYLVGESGEQAILRDMLSVGYSEFFRNSLSYSVLEHVVLPLIVARNKISGSPGLRIWSAACAGGEEVYSMAILMSEFIGSGKTAIPFWIFATDAQEEMINKAKVGRYDAGRMGNVSLKRINRYFKEHDGFFIVNEELKKNIEFSVFDLLDSGLSCPPPSIYGEFDVVYCANLLFYYKPDYQSLILEKASGCLKKDGFIISGEVERDILMNHGYMEVYPHSAIFQRKGWKDADGMGKPSVFTEEGHRPQ